MKNLNNFVIHNLYNIVWGNWNHLNPDLYYQILMILISAQL